MNSLTKIKELLFSNIAENIELAFYLLSTYEGQMDEAIPNFIMSESIYLQRCIMLKCRCVYPYIHTAGISFFQPADRSESIAFWEEFSALQALEKVTFSNLCYEEDWAAALCKLPNLKTLSLNQNRLEFLPQSLGKLRQLYTLAVNEEYITTLPDFISEFTQLQSLSIRYCQLNRLPDWLVKLENLESLLVPDNLLSELPVSIGFLKNLKFLDISNNQLKKLPPTLTELTQLTHLFISNNSISAYDKSQWYNILPKTLIL